MDAPPTRETVLAATLRPYDGPSALGVDPSTPLGKVWCGYQGWFCAEGDGSGRGWVHWSRRGGAPAPGTATFDLWPDVSELGPDERFATGFRHADGRVAEVFSAHRRPTVRRHFRWMREHGIDGAFVQRFVVDLEDPRGLRHNNVVLDSCRAGANESGRAYALMYDLSGLGAGRMGRVLGDFRELRGRMGLGRDPAYLRHRGKPLVAVWGVGFSDGRAYTLAECRDLVASLKSDGFSVMLGIPAYWREGTRDAVADPLLREVVAMADIASPWTVGRYADEAGARRHAAQVLGPDLAWCRGHGVDYLPVVFPGFSWHNLRGGASDQIPRRGGRFLWSQFAAFRGAGAGMAYVAMFDEVDEGTAVFKCTDDVPSPGASVFVGTGGLPPDHYLRLVGAAARHFHAGEPVPDAMPPR